MCVKLNFESVLVSHQLLSFAFVERLLSVCYLVAGLLSCKEKEDEKNHLMTHAHSVGIAHYVKVRVVKVYHSKVVVYPKTGFFWLFWSAFSAIKREQTYLICK